MSVMRDEVIRRLCIEYEVSDKELKSIKQHFRCYDADDNGTIDIKELKQLLNDMGGDEYTDDDAEIIHKQIDSDDNGKVEFSEFLKWWVGGTVKDGIGETKLTDGTPALVVDKRSCPLKEGIFATQLKLEVRNTKARTITTAIQFYVDCRLEKQLDFTVDFKGSKNFDIHSPGGVVDGMKATTKMAPYQRRLVAEVVQSDPHKGWSLGIAFAWKLDKVPDAYNNRLIERNRNKIYRLLAKESSFELSHDLEPTLERVEKIEDRYLETPDDEESDEEEAGAGALPTPPISGKTVVMPPLPPSSFSSESMGMGMNPVNRDLPASFIDLAFPPLATSVLGPPLVTGLRYEGEDGTGMTFSPQLGPTEKIITTIEWRRPHKFFGNEYEVFEGKIEPMDIRQGSLGDCWFMSALAALTEFPFLVKRLFESGKANKAGVYRVKICKGGMWRSVLVDDYFPCFLETGPIFSSANGNELWVLLLEKAYAKCHGSYWRLRGGWASEGMADLTGMPTKTYRVKEIGQPGSEFPTPDALWAAISHWDRMEMLMCCSTPGTDKYTETGGPTPKTTGLVPGHAYSLISAAELDSTDPKTGKKYRLVHLRNPWGRFEWGGDWGDSSPLWTEEVKAEIERKVGIGAEELAVEGDGAFWMSYEDWLKHFISIEVCFLHSFKGRGWFDLRRGCQLSVPPLALTPRITNGTTSGGDEGEEEEAKPYADADGALFDDALPHTSMYKLTIPPAKSLLLEDDGGGGGEEGVGVAEAIVSIHQVDKRVIGSSPYIDIGFALLKDIAPNCGIDVAVDAMDPVRRKQRFRLTHLVKPDIKREMVSDELRLKPGSYYIVPLTTGCRLHLPLLDPVFGAAEGAKAALVELGGGGGGGVNVGYAACRDRLRVQWDKFIEVLSRKAKGEGWINDRRVECDTFKTEIGLLAREIFDRFDVSGDQLIDKKERKRLCLSVFSLCESESSESGTDGDSDTTRFSLDPTSPTLSEDIAAAKTLFARLGVLIHSPQVYYHRSQSGDEDGPPMADSGENDAAEEAEEDVKNEDDGTKAGGEFEGSGKGKKYGLSEEDLCRFMLRLLVGPAAAPRSLCLFLERLGYCPPYDNDLELGTTTPTSATSASGTSAASAVPPAHRPKYSSSSAPAHHVPALTGGRGVCVSCHVAYTGTAPPPPNSPDRPTLSDIGRTEGTGERSRGLRSLQLVAWELAIKSCADVDDSNAEDHGFVSYTWSRGYGGASLAIENVDEEGTLEFGIDCGDSLNTRSHRNANNPSIKGGLSVKKRIPSAGANEGVPGFVLMHHLGPKEVGPGWSRSLAFSIRKLG